MTTKMFGVPAGMAVAALVVMCAEPSAQRGGRGGAPQPAPVATNTILQNPDAFYGKQVTISAGVEEMLSKTAFVVDQQKVVGATEVAPIGRPILVIAPHLSRPLDAKRYVLMSGLLVKFDAAAIGRVAAGYTLDLPPDAGAKYQGRPVLVATSVRNSAYTELAAKPLPAPTPSELSLMAAMKSIGPAFAAMRTAALDSKTNGISENVAKLKPAFGQAETIWDDLGQSAAAEWARQAQERADIINAAAAAGQWETVKSSSNALNQLCQNCHTTYRDRLEDGTFRIKAGTF